ncbi:trihelix transcription factor GT-3a-like isoform X2 [Labeo rohita]|uniref:Trihelix transcription factor GT-3a-like isoform X2 n=1 Tax=Labeo rohita TaxID=84645 RepID=A0A498LPZ6_LABRO|nr:trihelix transcription factor GT-3a-like isoform X2 [Labeo rohita]
MDCALRARRWNVRSWISNGPVCHRPLATTSDHGLDIGFGTEEKDADDGGGGDSQGEGPGEPEKRKKERSSSALSTSFSQHQDFLERMQVKQNEWAETQLLQSQEREQRLLNGMMEISSRNTEHLVSLLLEGLRAPPIAPWRYMQP